MKILQIFIDIIINGKKYDYIEVLKDKLLRKILSDEAVTDFYRYDY